MPASTDRPTVVLAFSGGLDTSYCVPLLRERGYDVITLFVDTGGMSDADRAGVEARAEALGAIEHITEDAGPELFETFIVPFVMGGAPYQNQYPLLCADRYIIARRMVALARARGAQAVAHGCTAMGNDQVRFDHVLRTAGDLEIIAPIRELQSQTSEPRAYEIDYLRQRGIEVSPDVTRYTINENLLGATISGAEIDEFNVPSSESYRLTRPAAAWPNEPTTLTIEFHEGVPVALNHAKIDGPALMRTLNERLGAYGIGRGIYTGDTVIGLKGRIAFECPGLTALLVAHRALEEAVLTRGQNAFKPIVARQWTELVYTGQNAEPLCADLEAFLRSSQRVVTGTVTLATAGGRLDAVAIDSPHILVRPGATYAQSSDWSAEEAIGFIKLLGQSTAISAAVNPRPTLEPVHGGA